MDGPHLRNHRLLLDEQSEQILAMTDPIADRLRKIGATAIRSIGHIGLIRHIDDNDSDFSESLDIIRELRDDNIILTSEMRQIFNTCNCLRDTVTARLLKVWIDEAEGRSWFLHETARGLPGFLE